MNHNLEQLQSNIASTRQQVINHKVYDVINDVTDLQIFMQYHVFAVWDFMSLLKSLQINLTCTKTPWYPVGDSKVRQLINEIVLGEESDVDYNGDIKSHYEMYIDAMQQCGADTSVINQLVSLLSSGCSLDQAINQSNLPIAAQQFLNFTFSIIDSNQLHLQSAIFTFGREDLIPDMFVSIINELNKSESSNVSQFNYYLQRHIEIDGDHHSQLALDMICNLCGTNNKLWFEAQNSAIQALEYRIKLWDAAYNHIINRK